MTGQIRRLRPRRRAEVVDVRDAVHEELLAVSLGDGTTADTWRAVMDVEGFVGAMNPRTGAIRALFVRRAATREIAERELVIDLRDVAVEVEEVRCW